MEEDEEIKDTEFDKDDFEEPIENEELNYIEDDILDDEQDDELEDEDDEDINEQNLEKTTLDYLEERIGQELEAGRLNVVLRNIFMEYTRNFIMPSDLYNMDLSTEQVLTIFDDEEEYHIYYDIIDVDSGLIKITGVDML